MPEIAALLATAIVAAVGAYFGAYLRKKGENFATKEDVAVLVQQQTQIQSALQRIEHEGWLQQQRWEFKRQAIWDLLRLLQNFRNALVVRAGGQVVPGGDERAMKLAEEVVVAVTICRAVLPNALLERFDGAVAPIRRTDLAAAERAEIAKQVIRDLQDIARTEMYGAAERGG